MAYRDEFCTPVGRRPTTGCAAAGSGLGATLTSTLVTSAPCT